MRYPFTYVFQYPENHYSSPINQKKKMLCKYPFHRKWWLSISGTLGLGKGPKLGRNSHNSLFLGQFWGIGTHVALTRFPITSSEPHFQRPDSHLSQCWSMTHSRCLVCGNRLVLPPSWSYRTFCHLFFKCASWPVTYNAQKGHFLTNLPCRIAHRLVRSNKVCGPYVVTLLNWTPIFEWYMARLVVKYIWTLYMHPIYNLETLEMARAHECWRSSLVMVCTLQKLNSGMSNGWPSTLIHMHRYNSMGLGPNCCVTVRHHVRHHLQRKEKSPFDLL